MKHLTPLLLSVLTASAFAGAPLSGIDLAGGDAKVRPQDDIFRAVNGVWLEQTPIPADKHSWGNFFILRERSDQQIKAIVDELAAAKPKAGAVEGKVAAYYRSYVDVAAIERAGLKPLRPMLDRIARIKDKRAMVAMFGEVQGVLPTPVALFVDTDPKNPDRYVARTYQSGLGMPDRDYYLKDDERLAKTRAAYLDYVRVLLTRSGDPAAEAHANAVIALERSIAEAHWDKVENRNPVKIYNPMTVAELSKQAPQIDWPLLLKNASFPAVEQLVVSQPSQVIAIARLVDEVPLATWKAYLTVRTLDAAAEMLPKAYRDARFAFRDKVLTGAEQERPRWQQATAQLDAALGEALGQVYVARHFPPAYKARMQELVANLMTAYRESIDGLTWMSAETKAKAREKLSKYVTKIGYPDKWRDYSKLAIVDGDPVGNAKRARRFEYERRVARINDKVDRAEWHMTPQTVNAYYNPASNEIAFPAGILQPPFFDMRADDAVNYGAIGAVIGHEISHGFDDQGSQYDGDGKLQSWWSENDRKAFEALGARLIAQYEQYEPLPGKRINGKLSLGENIADLSGLQIAYKAYKLSLKDKPAPVIDGLSGEQRFFYGWSQAWRTKMREATLLQRLVAGPHSPPEFRANGAVVNHDGFHDAFATRPGDRLFKAADERIRIW